MRAAYDPATATVAVRVPGTPAMLQGALVHAIAQTYPLDKIAEAHKAVESGAVTGNVVVTIA